MEPESEVRYKGQESEKNADSEWNCRTLESRCLVVMPIWLIKTGL